MKFITILIFIILSSCQTFGQAKFSKKQVLNDLDYLKNSLITTQYNCYHTITEDAFEKEYHKIKSKITRDSLSLLEATRLLQQLPVLLNNGHTRISFPVQSYINYAQTGGTIFPLEVAIEKGKVLVRKNWSKKSDIQIEDQLISINNQPIQKILETIYSHIAAERIYFKSAQLEFLTLPRLYWLAFGEQKIFEVEISKNDRVSTYKLASIKAIEDYETKRDDIIKRDRNIKFLSSSTAYLRPGEFGGDEDQYRKFVDSAFTEIKSKKSKILIIDLRNNPGGDDSFSDYLVSYIANKPFKWCSKFQLKTSSLLKEHVRKTKDTTTSYWKSTLLHEDGEIYEYGFGFYQPQPKSKRFHGNVYVLVNRQSYSQSTVTAAQIQDYNFGKIVGEETAEYPNLYASIFNYQLPETGISVDIAKGKIQRVSGLDNNKGVIPDIYIKDYLLDEKDEILEQLLKQVD